MLDIIKFLRDTEATEAFITGSAGTGKTTALIQIVNTLVKHNITFKVCAYTHKAVEVLQDKLPILKEDYVFTLHALLKKRPTINSKAIKIDNIMTSKQYGDPSTVQLLIIDEFSFIGEADYMTIGDLMDEGCKVLYIGDPAQLNPVKSYQAVVPNGEYHTHLTTVHRQENEMLSKLINSIKEGSNKIVADSNTIIKVNDLAEAYLKSKSSDKKILVFTNEKVQYYNRRIENKDTMTIGDKVVVQQWRTTHTITDISTIQPTSLVIVNNNIIDRGTKYNPLRTISQFKQVKYYELDGSFYIAAIEGVYDNKLFRNKLGEALTNKNRAKKDSRTEYRLYKTSEECVFTLEYPYCSTVHKAQGDEFEEVYIDYNDILKSTEANRLLYVAVSRAKNKLILSV